MRHRFRNRILGRKSEHRRSLLRSLSTAFLRQCEDGSRIPVIVTTIAKAKEVRPFLERLIAAAVGLARSGSERRLGVGEVELRRRAFAVLRDRGAVKVLFGRVASACAKRNGGYVRVVKLAEPRLGDGGDRAALMLVDS